MGEEARAGFVVVAVAAVIGRSCGGQRVHHLLLDALVATAEISALLGLFEKAFQSGSVLTGAGIVFGRGFRLKFFGVADGFRSLHNKNVEVNNWVVKSNFN